jgi:hypothetical protein
MSRKIRAKKASDKPTPTGKTNPQHLSPIVDATVCRASKYKKREVNPRFCKIELFIYD